MKDGLAIKFNHRAKKEVKTEDSIKVGVRRRADGSSMFVRGGKIVGVREAWKDHKHTLNDYRQAASDAAAKKHRLAQEHHKPRHMRPERPPRM